MNYSVRFIEPNLQMKSQAAIVIRITITAKLNAAVFSCPVLAHRNQSLCNALFAIIGEYKYCV